MRVLETAKFSRLRKKIADEGEKEALVTAIRTVVSEPLSGKKLHGELALLRSYAYSARGQSRRLVYKLEKQAVVLMSFGPRQGIYKG